MCKLGDIILVKEFKNEKGNSIPKHSFVVINDEEGYIEGLKYDFVSSMMCSFHNNKHKSIKLRFEENFEIKEGLISGKNINNKSGYIKADQLYYFNKKLIEFQIIEHMDKQLLNELVQLIIVLNEKGLLKNISSNLTNKLTN